MEVVGVGGACLGGLKGSDLLVGIDLDFWYAAVALS